MKEIIPPPQASLVEVSEVPTLLNKIRPAWQAKKLITRVKSLISVDPSSACQRIFNAAIHDLKEKIIVAGLDIAKEAAKQHKLPPVEKPEDVEEYSTAKLIDLAYRIGILSRPEWRRLSRCYEIRRDLEHEDDEYEAGVEDCVYIFKTCIDAVLSKDPIHLIRVTDVKDLIEQPQPSFPAQNLLEDFSCAPQPRQEEIIMFLCNIALDDAQPDLIRQNAFTFLSQLSNLASSQATLSVASHIQKKITRQGPSLLLIRVAHASGVLPYIKKAHIRDFYLQLHQNMINTSYRWTAYQYHGELLRSFRDIGGLLYCPKEPRKKILKWLVLCYLGERGGMTRYGNVRNVFYSNTAEPYIVEIIRESKNIIADELRELAEDKDVKKACTTKHIERRLENLLDLIEESND